MATVRAHARAWKSDRIKKVTNLLKFVTHLQNRLYALCNSTDLYVNFIFQQCLFLSPKIENKKKIETIQRHLSTHTKKKKIKLPFAQFNIAWQALSRIYYLQSYRLFCECDRQQTEWEINWRGTHTHTNQKKKKEKEKEIKIEMKNRKSQRK